VASAVLVLAGCSSSPTGRSQMLLFSSQQMDELGNASFEQMKAEQPVSGNRALTAYVRCVAAAVTRAVPAAQQPASWEVVLFDGEAVNAFALPGGKIGVYTGLLGVAKTQEQLAAVIGHEIGHVLAQHSNERLSRSQVADLGMSAVGSLISDTTYKGMTMAALGVGVQYGVLLPYSRAQEAESDVIGLKLMAEAGFDPRQSITLWKNMEQASGGEPPELLSTHPSHNTRIEGLQYHMPDALNAYHQAYSQGIRPVCAK
jgi:predicted Zn-dependent protease